MQNRTPSVSDTIVIAEDNGPYRKLLRIALSQMGFSVHDTADGRSAVVTTLALRPSLVVLDICMPGLSGVEAARQIRRDLAEGAPWLVALSALDPTRLDSIRQEGDFDVVLAKTKDIYALCDEIAALPAQSYPQLIKPVVIR
ncbi:MAG: response regulator [Pseudomonadota bacterium]